MEMSSVQARPNLPLAGLICALSAMAALYVGGEQYIGLPLLAFLLVSTFAVSWRLPRRILVTWPIRLVIFSAIVLTSPTRDSMTIWVVLDPLYVHLFGYLCAAELVLRVWQHRAGGPHLGEVVVLTSLVFVCATNTYEQIPMRIATPIFFISLLVLLRRFSPRPATSLRQSMPWLGIAVLVLAGSFTGAIQIRKYGRELTSWSISLLPNRPTSGEIGLSDIPELKSVFNPEPSPTRVMRIRGNASEMHLRAMAFDTSRSDRWFPALDYQRFQIASLAQLGAGASGQRVQFERMEDEFGVLCVPLNAAGLIAAEREVEINPPTAVLRTQDITGRYEFDVILPADHRHQGPLCTEPSQEYRDQCLAIHKGVEPGVQQIADAIAEGRDTPIERIMALEVYLRKNYTYSLQVERSTRDGVSEFLLTNKKGHCQYFASAAVVLLRYMGIPSRFVNGYYAHEREGPDEMVVRQRDAHAWAEAYMDGIGWITVDATPGGGRPDELFQPISDWRRRWERVTDAFAGLRQGLAKLTFVHVLIAGVAILAIAGLMELIKRLRGNSHVKSETHYADPDAALAELGRAFERQLAARGLRPARNRTWRELLTDACAVGAHPRLLDFADAYSAARFGAATPEQVQHLRAWLESIEQQRDK